MADREKYNLRNDYFMRLYEPHRESALAYACRLCGNTDDGRDLLQESLEAALVAFDSLRNADCFKPWFFRVLRNRRINRAQRLKLAYRFALDINPNSDAAFDEQTVERAKLLDALNALAPEEREALILFEVEGLQIRDIAMIQRRSVPAIKYRLRRGREKLRAAYFSDMPLPSAEPIPIQDE